MVLTDKQKHELHEAILEYMMADPDKYAKSIAAFSEEASVDTGGIAIKGLLEKKWTAVIRLQKKVCIVILIFTVVKLGIRCSRC